MSIINREIWKFELVAIALASILYLCVMFLRLNILYFFLYSIVCSNISWLLWNGKKWWMLWIWFVLTHIIANQAITILLGFLGNYSGAAYSWIFAFGFIGLTIVYIILIPIFGLATYFSIRFVGHSGVKE